MIKTVKKRNGDVVPFDADKLNQWATWASENCNVHWNEVIFKSIKTVHEEVSTKELQQALIDACLSYRTEGHTKMAARLMLGEIYKEAFGDFKVPHLKDFYKKMVDAGFWTEMSYTDEELELLNDAMNHDIDFGYSYATLKQFYDKYGIRAFNKIYESPQFTYMGIAMRNMENEPKDIRISEVINTYECEARNEINLPTPTIVLERTPQLVGPSCCVITGKDAAESLSVVNHIAYTMTTKGAGIGIEINTRAPKEPVKGGKIEHGGKHPYYSMYDKAVKAAKQQVRGGSATITIHCLDPEIEQLLTLKQIRTEPTYRIDTMDYSFAVNNLFIRKVARNEDWMTVSQFFAPKLWELSYSNDQVAFEEEYERQYVMNPHKKVVKARDVFAAWVRARGDNGRVYISFLDNMNTHTPFIEEIRLSNLCQEISIVTQGYDKMEDLFKKSDDVEGEVGLCSLGAIVVSNIEDDAHYEKVAYYTAKIIDNTLENAVYPFPHIEHTAKARRSIGVGMTDLAHLMARKGLTYDSVEGRNFIHKISERHAYYMLKASVRLAKERGKCAWFHKTKYANETPWLPIDTYAKEVDTYHNEPLHYDWEGLRKEIKKYGVRFSVETAIMPNESSSVLTNTTNSIYPIRQKEMWKSSPKGMVYFRAPEMEKYEYQYAFDISDLDMVKVYSIIQKFTNQAISADFYTKLDSDETKLSMRDMLQRVIMASKSGMKTFYYENYKTKTQLQQEQEQDKEHIEDDDDGCSSCKL